MPVIRNEQVSVKRVVLLVLFFFLIKLSFFSIALYRIVIFSLMLLELSKNRYLLLKKIDRDFLIPTVGIIGLSFARSCFTGDITIPFYLFESILNLFSAIIIFNLFYADKSRYLLLKEIVYALLVQSSVMIFMLISPPVKQFLNMLFPSNVPAEKWVWRHVGLTGFSAYNMGMFLAFGVFLTIILFQKNIFSLRRTVLFCLIFFATAILSARSSFIVFIFIAIYFLGFIKSRKSIKFLLIIFTVLVLSFWGLYQYSLVNAKFKFIFDWMFSIIITVFERGNSIKDVQGVKVIGENFYWNPELKTFLFGDGYYGSPNGSGYYMATDAGYMRRLLYFGFFLSFFFYLIFINYFICSACFVKDKHIRFFLVSLIAIIMIVQYKGDFFIDSGESFRMGFLISYAFRSRSCQNENSICTFAR